MVPCSALLCSVGSCTHSANVTSGAAALRGDTPVGLLLAVLCSWFVHGLPAAARACKDDIAKFCKDASDSEAPGSVVQCLRCGGGAAPACCPAGHAPADSSMLRLLH
jgi:hypothetical protein